MTRRQTIVQLSEELLAELDAEAARRGDSRSAVIREAVAEYLAGGRRARQTQQIIDGYRRIPQGTSDEWGDLAAQSDGATAEMLRRLDDEEAEPW